MAHWHFILLCFLACATYNLARPSVEIQALCTLRLYNVNANDRVASCSSLDPMACAPARFGTKLRPLRATAAADLQSITSTPIVHENERPRANGDLPHKTTAKAMLLVSGTDTKAAFGDDFGCAFTSSLSEKKGSAIVVLRRGAAIKAPHQHIFYKI